MSKTFQETLEDARYEVSINIYPNNIPYQIFKPPFNGAHCWEVYRFPGGDEEVEVGTGCDSLEDAAKAVAHDMDRIIMGDDEWRRYSDAVDLVCINCRRITEQECDSCLVRTSMDKIKDMRKWRDA